LLAVASACGGQGGSPEPAAERFQLTEVDGVAVATTSGGPLYEGNLFDFKPILELRQDPGLEESLLFGPVDFTVGPNGFYYVVDRGNSRIAVFDSEGNYVRAFGRRGDGPGEFGDTMLLQSFDGDVLAIFEFQSQRTSRFATDGTFLETISLPGSGLAISLDRGPGDTLIVTRSNRQSDDDSAWESWRMEILDDAGAKVLAAVSTGSVRTTVTQALETADGPVTLSRSMPYVGSPTVRYVPERGVLVTDGDKPALRWHGFDGVPTKRIVIDLPVRPITAAIRGDWEERQRKRRVEAARARGAEPQPYPTPEYPNAVGLWSSVLVDDAGYIWLLDVWSAHQRSDDEGFNYHVVDPEGRYLGLAELPARRAQIRDNRLMTILEDPISGEAVPTVFSITSAVPGLVYRD
jgi:hypothetical protein